MRLHRRSLDLIIKQIEELKMIRLLKGEIEGATGIHNKTDKMGVSKRNPLITREQKILMTVGVEAEEGEGEVTRTTTIETTITTKTIPITTATIATSRNIKTDIERETTSETTERMKSKKIGTGIIMAISTTRGATGAEETEETEDSPVAIPRMTMGMEGSTKTWIGVDLECRRIIMKLPTSLKVGMKMHIVPTIETLSRNHNQNQSRQNPNQCKSRANWISGLGVRNAGLKFRCTFRKTN